MVARGFLTAWERALAAETDGADLARVLRSLLKELLDRDLDRRLEQRRDLSGNAGSADLGAVIGSLANADIDALTKARDGIANDLASGTPDHVGEAEADAMLAHYGLPGHLRRGLIVGMIQANLRAWEIVQRRKLGTAPMTFGGGGSKPSASPTPNAAAPPSPPDTPRPRAKPPSSALFEPFMVRRETIDRATHQVMGQERGTLRRFVEVCGDRPVNEYGRGDMIGFIDTLRRLPNTYGKSPKDKNRPLAEIIAEADATEAERLTDKTVKRHLSALSQFFQFAVDAGHITVTARNELVGNHRFRAGHAARDQRDEWTVPDLQALFASPVWTGCHAYYRTEPGPQIIRDAKFWLPLLALHHGARLEELADLYRRDMGSDGGTHFLRITETEDRRLKTDNAERIIPLHPELARLGFLDYAQETAPNPNDPLFPDLAPQGKDRKRGPRFTRWFVEYRKALGIYRPGVGAHAFRHTAITRLRDTIEGHQQDRHIDFLMGHARDGGEGRTRYDKGPGLKAVAATLALLRFPEIDLSHLYPGEVQDNEAA